SMEKTIATVRCAMMSARTERAGRLNINGSSTATGARCMPKQQAMLHCRKNRVSNNSSLNITGVTSRARAVAWNTASLMNPGECGHARRGVLKAMASHSTDLNWVALCVARQVLHLLRTVQRSLFSLAGGFHDGFAPSTGPRHSFVWLDSL